MPFPWKKNRVTRIIRIMADLRSPKHCSSLVVQTGFPTSLIDLFVKNRPRFTKPKSNKPQISDPPPQPPETSSSNNLTAVRAEAPNLTRLVTVNNVGGVGDDGGVTGSGREVNRVSECGCGPGSKLVLAMFVKMLFVAVVLITSTKNLTVGITVSAFALMSLENAGKRFVSFLRPCSDSKMGIMEPLNCVWLQNLQLNRKKDCEGSDSELSTILRPCSNSLSLDEIEVVETKACLLDSVNGDKKLSCPEMMQEVDACKILRCESKVSRSVRFKSKMVKKLVPKKLRSSMKERKGKKSKEMIVKEEGDEEKNGNGSRVEEVNVISEEDSNNNRIQKIGNSGYMTLFVIALAGLVMGRFSALILTMTWCFLLKIVSCNNARKITESSVA